MNLKQIANILSLPVTSDMDLTGFCIDSRTVSPGNIFVALEGTNLNTHVYIQKAVAKGAAAVLCHRPCVDVTVPQLVVPDTTAALRTLAKAHRACMKGPVIAVTGSNGKTTVKEMIAAILPKPAHATQGNFNNHLGAPLTILQLRPEHRYAVFELGANHIGEIAYTVDMVKPKVSLINNIAPAHVEGFGSIEGVAKAKGEIYEGLADDGIAIINADDAYAHFWDPLIKDKTKLYFSASQKADIYAKNIQLDEKGCANFTLVLPQDECLIQLKVPGKHQVNNALAAASCTYAAGISKKDIMQGLNQFGGVSGRMTWLAGKNQSTIIDDTYNANLRSVLTALDVLALRKGKRIFVFGDMGELGTFTEKHHQEVGAVAKQLGIDLLVTCGKHSQMAAQSFGETAIHYTTQEGLACYLIDKMDKDTTVLVKGSRSSSMERIVHQLLKE